MSQISSKHVIAYLNNRKRELEEKIHHIDNTISLLSDLRLQQSFISGKLDIDEQRISHSRQLGKPSLELKIEKTFDPDFKLDRKIAYVLTSIESGFKNDIVAGLHALQPELNIHKLEKQLAVRLSYLLKIGAIKGDKISRSYRYSLFE